MAEVRLEGISKSFGDTQAIQGLDLTIHDGEFFVLLGPTGTGKTETCLNLAKFLHDTKDALVRFDMGERPRGQSQKTYR